MGFKESIYDRIPSSATLPAFQDVSKLHSSPRVAFLKKRIRLKGSSVSVPLGVILLFPVTVLALVLMLMIPHPGSGGGGIFTGSPPPMMRYAKSIACFQVLYADSYVGK